MKKDICVPEFCCCSDEAVADCVDEAEVDDVDINAWFGPEGTVSPLHFDPKHNLLAQVNFIYSYLFTFLCELTFPFLG